MKEGEYYPHLRQAKIHPGVNSLRELKPSRTSWELTDQTVIAVQDVEILPTVVIEIPLRDWEGIMEIYQTHFHAQNRSAAVLHAWAQYQLLVKLSK